MKKTAILTISILVIFVISMSFVLIGCNDSDKLVGTWKNDLYPDYLATFEKIDGNIVVTKMQSYSTTDWDPVKYNNETKEYELKHKLGTKFFGVKIIDSNTIEIKDYTSSNQSVHTYTRVS